MPLLIYTKLASAINNRRSDFIKNIISDYYVVFNNQSVVLVVPCFHA